MKSNCLQSPYSSLNLQGKSLSSSALSFSGGYYHISKFCDLVSNRASERKPLKIMKSHKIFNTESLLLFHYENH